MSENVSGPVGLKLKKGCLRMDSRDDILPCHPQKFHHGTGIFSYCEGGTFSGTVLVCVNGIFGA
jgi:hypothetical protein